MQARVLHHRSLPDTTSTPQSRQGTLNPATRAQICVWRAKETAKAVTQSSTKLPKYREGDTSPTSTAFPGLQQGATSHVICGDSPEEPRWQGGARELGPRRWTEFPTHPDSPVCASRCSGHRTSRSTVKERRQHQHGSGDQGNSQAESPLPCWHTTSAWPQTVMVWPDHGDNTVPSSSSRSRGSSGTWLQPTGWTQSSQGSCRNEDNPTGAALPPQAAAANTTALFGGKPDSNSHRNQISGLGHITQKQGEGKASLHVL